MDGRVTCPRSSVHTVLLHTRAVLATKRRWLLICSQLQTAFSQGSAQRTLGTLLLSMLFHSGPSIFFNLFLHFSGVSRFLLLIEMPLSSIILFPPPHCSCLWFSTCLVFACGPYLACIALMLVGQEQRLLRGGESRQTGLIWNNKKTLGKDSNDTVWLLLLKDAGLTTRICDQTPFLRMEQKGKNCWKVLLFPVF